MSKPESKVEQQLVKGCKARGGWAAKMVDMGRRGAPDRELRFPEGKVIYAETKAADGILQSWQSHYHADLRALGFKVVVLWTIDHVDRFFANVDGGMY